MDDVMNASKEFFRLPLEEKQKYSNLIDGKHFQVEGYDNDQIKTEEQVLEWSDRLHLRVGPEDAINLANWPRHPESFRSPFCFLKYNSNLPFMKWIPLHFNNMWK
jgi:isopenicillin N synthase-like dioxygenase